MPDSSDRLFGESAPHLMVALGRPIIAMLLLAWWGGRLVDAVLLLFLVLSHEAAHLAVASGLGCRIMGIRILPLGGILYLGAEATIVPVVEALIAAAGPLHHFLLLALAGLSGAFQEALGEHWLFFLRANWSMAFFNILPIYPMDGGRILHALLTKGAGAAGAAKIVLKISRVCASVLIVFGIAAFLLGKGLFPLLCGGYLLWIRPRVNGTDLSAHLRLQAWKRRWLSRKGAGIVKLMAVGERTLIWQCLARAASRRYTVFCILGGNGAIRSWVTEEEAMAALGRGGLGTAFAACLDRELRQEDIWRMSNQLGTKRPGHG